MDNFTLEVTLKLNTTEDKVNDSAIENFDFGAFKSPFDVPHVRGIYIFLFSAIFVCCVLGNLAVIYVILCHKKTRNVTNFFLANLAVSDLCVGVFCVLPNLSTYLSTIWYLGRAMCKIYYFIQCTSYTASVLILTVISLERYFAIIHPMLNRRITRMKLMRFILVLVWILAAIYGIPNLVAYDIISVSTGEIDNSTIEFCVSASGWNIDMGAYSIVNFILLYIVPLLLLTTVYIRISVVLWKTSGTIPRQTECSRPRTVASGSRGQLKCSRCDRFVIPRDISRISRNGVNSDAAYRATRDERPHSSLDENRQWAQPVSGECQCACTMELNAKMSKYNGKSLMYLIPGHKPRPAPVNSALATRRKVIRLLICIIVSFALCVLPHHVRILWQYWSPDRTSFSFGHALIPPSTFLFFYANSALNPFLYALLSDRFRKAFRDVFGNCCKSRRPMDRSSAQRNTRVRRESMYSEGTTSFQTLASISASSSQTGRI